MFSLLSDVTFEDWIQMKLSSTEQTPDVKILKSCSKSFVFRFESRLLNSSLENFVAFLFNIIATIWHLPLEKDLGTRKFICERNSAYVRQCESQLSAYNNLGECNTILRPHRKKVPKFQGKCYFTTSFWQVEDDYMWYKHPCAVIALCLKPLVFESFKIV